MYCVNNHNYDYSIAKLKFSTEKIKAKYLICCYLFLKKIFFRVNSARNLKLYFSFSIIAESVNIFAGPVNGNRTQKGGQ